MFGEAGNGRGLIDAMARFGCKAHLRKKMIIRTDNWFMNVEQTQWFLLKYFEKDIDSSSKRYNLIWDNCTVNTRKLGRESRPVPGCRAPHVLSFQEGDKFRVWEWDII